MPYVLLAAGCGLSITVTRWVAADDEARAQAAFLTEAGETRQRIQVRLNSYVQLLEAGAALLGADNEINAPEFGAFVSRLELRQAYPGIQGIGFVQYVRRPDVAQFLKLIRLDGIRSLRIWPAGSRPDYYPQIFLEPSDDTNRKAIGFDLSTDPTMLAAMERARDTGQPAATSESVILQTPEGPGLTGFAVFLPVYRSNAAVATVEARRRALVGFVYGPFRTDALQAELSLATSSSVAFGIFPDATRAPLMVSKISAPDAPRFRSEQRVAVVGQPWLVEVHSVQPADGELSLMARASLAAGLLISLMVFAVTRAQAGAWAEKARHAWELQEYASALRQSDTELRHAVALEREARAIAQTADRAKDEFLATLSHELRTPLNAILGWTAMLRTGAVAQERHGAALEIIARNAQLQAQLVEDLLDISRITAGTIRLERSVVTLAPIVEAALESLKPVAERNRVDLVVDMPSDDLPIYADATRVQQVVSNVLGNAIKFTPEGGRVFLHLARDAGHVAIHVRDTGIGISQEFLPHVFEPFRQADSSTTRAHSGVGLGLAIVRRLVEMHDGTIEARSDGLNKGAVFIVRLPLEVASPDRTLPGVPRHDVTEAPTLHVKVEGTAYVGQMTPGELGA